MTRLALVAPRPAAAAGDELLEALARAIAPRVAELLGERPAAGELVDVLSLLPGARRAEKRAVQGACRSGAIAGAVKLARRWRAPRESVVAFLREAGPRVVPGEDADEGEGDDLEDLRAALARPEGRRTRRRTG